MKYEAVKGGLRVAKLAGGYAVLHAESSLPAAQGLRQRRFAEQARDELLATGVDFTLSSRAVQAERKRWEDVYYRWYNRTHVLGDALEDLDPETFEYYPDSTRYGQFIPSEVQAAEMRQLAEVIRELRPVDAHGEYASTYIREFRRLGFVTRDDDDRLTWIGAKA